MKSAHISSTVSFVVLLFSGTTQGADGPLPIRFSRDILPILSDNCFQCHGPDEQARKAKLRLDRQDGIAAQGKSGRPIIISGKPAQSELIRRITSQDATEVMPPAKTNRRLTPEQKERLRRWIEEGAVWAR